MSQKKKQTEEVHIECPVCKGAGTVPRPVKHERLARRDAVQVLIDAGFSYREIASLLGYNSPGSIQSVLKIKDN